MTSFETLLAAANFVEANDRPGNSAHDAQLLEFAAQGDQLSFVPDVKSSEDTEESKGGGGVGRSSSDYVNENTRQTHNKLEKNRRAVLKDCFESLKKQIPSSEDRRSSNLDVLQMAVKYVQTLKMKSKELERSRSRLQQQNSSLHQRLVALQLHDSSVAPPTSPSTDTADDGSPFVSDSDELDINSGASKRPFSIRLVTTDDNLRRAAHSTSHTSEPSTGSGLVTCDVTTMLAAQSKGAEVTRCGETASILAEMHQSTATVSRSLTIAQLTGARPSLSSQPSIATRHSASRGVCSSSNNLHSVDSVNSDTRSGPRHGRTVVQMLQDSLVQKAQSQEVAASGSSSNCNKVVRGQTRCAKLPTSAATATAAVEVISPGVLMPAAAGSGFVLTLDQQQVTDVGCSAQSQCVASVLSSASSHQLSSGLSPTIGQLVLCPTPTVPSQIAYQSAAPLTVAAAGATSPSNSAAQFCTVLGSVTSVPLLPVSALVQSVQVVPAAAVGVSVPVSPVFVAGSVSGPSALFMVPN